MKLVSLILLIFSPCLKADEKKVIESPYHSVSIWYQRLRKR